MGCLLGTILRYSFGWQAKRTKFKACFMAELFGGHTRINSTLWPKETKRSEGKGIKKMCTRPWGRAGTR